MKITKAKKLEMIKAGQARVSKCDGSYFFYAPNALRPIKLNKDLFLELEWAQAEIELKIELNKWEGGTNEKE